MQRHTTTRTGFGVASMGLLGIAIAVASVGCNSSVDRPSVETPRVASPTEAAVETPAPASVAPVAHITDAQFEDTIREGVVLVDFWAPWCGPCRQQLPILDDVSKQLPEDAKIVKMNVDEEMGVAQRLGVSSIPTLILYADGEIVDRFVGVQSKSKLLNAFADAEEERQNVAMKESLEL